MEKAIVFGGSGFIGSHVADYLTNEGYDVTIFDIIKSPYIRKEQKMIISSVLDAKQINQAIKGNKYVFHFAAIADIQEAAENPLKTINTNVLSTNIILDACVTHNVKKFLFASTIYVYSEFGSFYKTSKQCCELLIENYNKVYGLNCVVMRFGSLYGNRANEFNPIANMIKQAILNKKIIRNGDGSEIRNYINVLDAANACVKLLKPSKSLDYVMITGNQTMTINKILLMINEILGNKIEIIYTGISNKEHYKITPYNFKKPNVAKKINLEYVHDFGQGILDCIYEFNESLNK